MLIIRLCSSCAGGIPRESSEIKMSSLCLKKCLTAPRLLLFYSGERGVIKRKNCGKAVLDSFKTAQKHIETVLLSLVF